jgi:hypothetical protein
MLYFKTLAAARKPSEGYKVSSSMRLAIMDVAFLVLLTYLYVHFILPPYSYQLAQKSRRTFATFLNKQTNKTKQTPWSASELYRPIDLRLSAKLVPTFADRGCHMVSVTDPYDRILGFIDRNRYFYFK